MDNDYLYIYISVRSFYLSECYFFQHILKEENNIPFTAYFFIV